MISDMSVVMWSECQIYLKSRKSTVYGQPYHTGPFLRQRQTRKVRGRWLLKRSLDVGWLIKCACLVLLGQVILLRAFQVNSNAKLCGSSVEIWCTWHEVNKAICTWKWRRVRLRLGGSHLSFSLTGEFDSKVPLLVDFWLVMVSTEVRKNLVGGGFQGCRGTT